MRNTQSLLIAGLLLAAAPTVAQNEKRVAILPIGGLRRDLEDRLVNELTTQLVNDGGVQVVDRARITPELLSQLSGANSGIIDRNSIANVGSVLGVSQILFVGASDGGATTSTEKYGSKTVMFGNVWLKALVRVYSVGSGVILAVPTSNYALNHQKLAEADPGTATQHIGLFPIPGRPATSSGDPQIELKRLVDEAFQAVEAELAPKIAAAIPSTPIRRVLQKQVKVAGVKNGLTFLNAGSSSGLDLADTFDIVRLVDSGMTDPDTGKSMMQRKRICKLTVSDLDESIASGTCAGQFAAANGDLAIPSAK